MRIEEIVTGTKRVVSLLVRWIYFRIFHKCIGEKKPKTRNSQTDSFFFIMFYVLNAGCRLLLAFFPELYTNIFQDFHPENKQRVKGFLSFLDYFPAVRTSGSCRALRGFRAGPQ